MSTVTQGAAEQDGPGLSQRVVASARDPIPRRIYDGLERNVFLVFVLGICCAEHARLVRGSLISDAWYTVLGGHIVSHSGLPRSDTLTVLTLGRRWVDQQWLAQLGGYGLWLAGGWRLVLLSVVAIYLASFVVLGASARRFGASDRSVALVAGASFVTGLSNTVPRAQIGAYLLYAFVFVLLLADARQPSRRVYLVLPLLVLWANIHGSILVGAALVSLRGLTLAGTMLRTRSTVSGWLPRASVLVVAPWLCTLVSPYGLRLPGYYRSVLGNSTLEHTITEWGPSTIRGQPFFFALLLLGGWLLARSRGTATPFARLAFAATAVLGLFAVRNEVWFALTAAAVLPAALDALWAPSAAVRRRQINLALGAVGAALAAASVAATAAHPESWFLHNYPPRAAAAVAAAARSDSSLRVFADERYADWLLFKEPQLAGRVAYDIRYELLTQSQLSTLFAFRTEHGLDWQRAARGYGLLVLDPSGDTGALKLFLRSPGTRVLYRDNQVVVLRRPVTRGKAS